MTRTTAREIAIHCAYSIGFFHQTAEEFLQERLTPDTFQRWKGEDPLYQEYPNKKQVAYITQLVKGVGDHGPELDDYIERYAKNWKFARISRTAAAIMRVAMYEILYMPEIPNATAINEAVEIAKGYEEPKGVAFINGILGAFVRAEFPDTTPPKPVAAEPEADEVEEAFPEEEIAASEDVTDPEEEAAVSVEPAAAPDQADPTAAQGAEQ